MGRFGRPVGINGQIKLYVFSDGPESLINYQPWQVKDTDGQWRILECNDFIVRNKFLLVSVNNINSRSDVEYLTNKEVAVERCNLPKLTKDEYYWRDLIELEVTNHNNISLGKVSHLIETGANDVLVVGSKDKQHLIPFLLDDYIVDIDLKEKKMIVNWDENF